MYTGKPVNKDATSSLATIQTTEAALLQCQYCNKLLVNKIQLEEHELLYHKIAQTNNEIETLRGKENYSCVSCGTTFFSLTKLSSHTNACILGVPIVKNDFKEAYERTCTFCGVKFTSSSRYSDHRKKCFEHAPKKPTIEKVKRFKCTYCKSLYAEKRNLASHIKHTHRIEIHQCQRCHQRFLQLPLLRKHKLMCTGKKNVVIQNQGEMYFITNNPFFCFIFI